MLPGSEGDFACGAVVSGFAFCFQSLADGRRHIQDVLLAGDLTGLSTAIAGVPPLQIETVTVCEFAVLDQTRLRECLGASTDTGDSLIHALADDVMRLGARGLRLARASAIERLAFFLSDYCRRVEAAGIVEEGDTEFPFPFTQEQVADMLGLSAVHVNRTFRKLRENGLLRPGIGVLRFPHRGDLALIATFDR